MFAGVIFLYFISYFIYMILHIEYYDETHEIGTNNRDVK